ncbi:MAG: translocation/assembly module TamB domain-containing protein, partial [Gemmatimonadales bacterium]
LVDPFIQPTFDVQSGELQFFGTPDLNPALDIRAIHTVRQPRQSANGRDVRVEVDITGTLSRPELALKNPDNLPLSQSDLLSYLVTGEPAVGLDNSGTTTAIAQGLGVRTIGNLLVNALPPNVLDYVELQTAAPGSDPAQSTNPSYYGLLNTRAVLGKQLGSRWFLGLSTGLCPSAFKENLGLQLEYRISPLYSAQAAIEPGSSNTRCGDKGPGSIVIPTQTPSQLGFDLFRNWRF